MLNLKKINKELYRVQKEYLESLDPEVYQKIKKARYDYYLNWRKANPDYNKEWLRAYYKKYPERFKAYQRRHREKKKALLKEAIDNEAN